MSNIAPAAAAAQVNAPPSRFDKLKNDPSIDKYFYPLFETKEKLKAAFLTGEQNSVNLSTQFYKQVEDAISRRGTKKSFEDAKDIIGQVKAELGSENYGKFHRDRWMEAVKSIHKGLCLIPEEKELAGEDQVTVARFYYHAYEALATLYDSRHLDNPRGHDMYSSLWIRKYGQLSIQDQSFDKVQQNSRALFENYGVIMHKRIEDLIREQKRMGGANAGEAHSRKEKRIFNELRQFRNKADNCLLSQAFAEFQTRPRLFETLLKQYKRIKTTLSSFLSLNQFALKSPAEFQHEKAQMEKDAEQMFVAVPLLSNVLEKVKLDLEGTWNSHQSGSPCLLAKQTFYENQTIFYEPVVAAAWTHEREHCTFCNKHSVAKVPCPNCTRAIFCGQRCLSFAQKGKHTEKSANCRAYGGDQLFETSSRLLYNFIYTTGGQPTDQFLKIIGDSTDVKAHVQKGKLSHILGKLLVHKMANSPANANEDKDTKAWRKVELEHLYVIIQKMENVNVDRTILEKLLCFFENLPQAHQPLGNQSNYALGAFGQLLVGVCQAHKPNTRRKLNQSTGNIEYVAKGKIEPGQVLTFQLPKGASGGTPWKCCQCPT